MHTLSQPAPANDFLKDHVNLLRQSYYRLVARSLTPPDFDDGHTDAQIAQYLYSAPMVLLSHNTDTDPIFNYANQAGLKLFELSWEELIQLPSRHSAETINQAERQKSLAQVSAHGYIENYQCVRIAKSGRRFQVNDAIVWNIEDAQGVYQGQAACFSEWYYI